MANTKIDISKLVITKTQNPKVKPEKSTLRFGQSFSDHMLEVDWDAEKGWGIPTITPYHNFSIDPAASVFHYGIECFEGMKAYIGKDGKVRIFRPWLNATRMNRSAQRVSLPPLDEDGFIDCIKALVEIEKDWIPEGEGFSLYIRPTFISTHPYVGVSTPSFAKLYFICCPVGPYYPTGWKPVKLLCSDEKYCRAWPGGSGSCKVGGNYAITLAPAAEATAKGYQQVLWLFNDKVTEVGTMNFFILWINEQGEKELITCPITDMILPGVTRTSVLEVARSWNEIKVSERDYTMTEVAKALQEGRVLEAFGTGTAAVVSPVCSICYKGVDYEIAVHDPNDPDAKVGPVTKRIYDEIGGICRGDAGYEDHPWVFKF